MKFTGRAKDASGTRDFVNGKYSTNVKKKYKTWEEKKLEEEEKLEKERVLKKIETKNITNENLEMEIINLVIKFPEYIRLF